MVYCKAWASWEEERVRTGALPQPEPNCPEEEPCRECDGEGLVATRAGRAIVELVAKAFKVERR